MCLFSPFQSKHAMLPLLEYHSLCFWHQHLPLELKIAYKFKNLQIKINALIKYHGKYTQQWYFGIFKKEHVLTQHIQNLQIKINALIMYHGKYTQQWYFGIFQKEHVLTQHIHSGPALLLYAYKWKKFSLT